MTWDVRRLAGTFGLCGLYAACHLAIAHPAWAQTKPDSKPSPLAPGVDFSQFGPRKPGEPAPPSSLPRLSDGHPDLTGVWFAGVKDLLGIDDSAVEMPLTPDYQAVRRKRMASIAAGRPYPDFVSTCQAFGMPRIMSYGTFEIISRPKEVWLLTEVLHETRRIYLDDRRHGEFEDAAFDGVSTGHWEGDTLVVHTEKIRAGYLDMTGAPHSDQLVVDERIRMINTDSLENTMTLRDPVALTKPWTLVQYYARQKGDNDIGEYICEENYRSGGGAVADPAANPANMLPPSAVSRGP